MRALIIAFVGGLAFAASAHAAPLGQAGRDQAGRDIAGRADCWRLRVGLAPAPLARPLGKLALGPLCFGRRSLSRLGHGAVLSMPGNDTGRTSIREPLQNPLARDRDIIRGGVDWRA